MPSCPPMAYRYLSIATRHTALWVLFKGATSVLQLSVSGLYLPGWKSKSGMSKCWRKIISAAGNNILRRQVTERCFHRNSALKKKKKVFAIFVLCATFKVFQAYTQIKIENHSTLFMGQCGNVTFGSFLSFRRVLQQTELVKLPIYYNSQILFSPLYSHNFLLASVA